MLNSKKKIQEQKIDLIGQTLTLKATREETDGACCIMETIMVPGGTSPFHIDRKVEEFFYVVDGEITVYVDKEIFHAKPGQIIHFPESIPHAFKNQTHSTAKALIFQLPAGNTEDFFKMMANVPKESPPPSTEELCKRSSQCGTDLLGKISRESFLSEIETDLINTGEFKVDAQQD